MNHSSISPRSLYQADTRLSQKTQHQRYPALDKSYVFPSLDRLIVGGAGQTDRTLNMTRDEFARRWLNAAASTRVEAPVPRGLTEAPIRVFREQAIPSPRMVRMGRTVTRLGRWIITAGLLFTGVCLLLLKLAPYAADYAATYLAF